MLKLFKKSFWILWEDVTARPSVSEAQSAIAKHCAENGHSCEFKSDEEAIIDGIPHEIICVRSAFYRGRYVIKCREK